MSLRLFNAGKSLLLLAWLLNVVTYGDSTPANCDHFMDVLFLLDSSESIRENDPFEQPFYYWELMKSFTSGVIGNLKIGHDTDSTKVAVVKYANHRETMFRFDQSLDAYTMQTVVLDLNHDGGNTLTAQALLESQLAIFAEQYGSRPSARHIVVLLTDGLSNYDHIDVKNVAAGLKGGGLTIYTVGVSKYTDEEELLSIATDATHMVTLENLVGLEKIVEDTVIRLCTPAIVPPRTLPPCNIKSDLAFIVDNSGSINEKNNSNYNILKNFVSSFVGSFAVGPDDNQFAIVRFGDDPHLEFYLNQFHSTAQIQAAIFNMAYEGGGTNTAGGLRMTREEVFQYFNGDRQDVRNVVVIITDGVSNIDHDDTIPQADYLKYQGAVIFVVGITNDVDLDELHALASDPIENHYFASPDIRYLDSIREQLRSYVCAEGNSNR